MRGEQGSAGVLDALQTFAGHLEDAHFVGRAEAVFHRAKDAHLPALGAFEVEDGIDEVFEQPRPGDLTTLGDVASDDRCYLIALRPGHQPRAGLRQLRRPAGAGVEAFDEDRLDRIDDHGARSEALSGGEGGIEVRFGDERDALAGDAEPRSAELHLTRRFLATDVGYGPPSRCQFRRRLKHER